MPQSPLCKVYGHVYPCDAGLYRALEQAVAEVPDDGTETTIQLLQNVPLENTLSIAAGKNIVLDLDGHTVSVSKNISVIDNI